MSKYHGEEIYKMKKILSVFLAILMLLACVACSEKTSEETTGNSNINNSDSVDTSTSGVPEGVKFDGQELTIWYTTNCVAGESKFDLNPSDLSNAVNSKVVASTMATQERLDVKINYFNSGLLTSEVGNEVRKHVFSGEDSFDIYQLIEWCSAELAIEGIYLNLRNMPYLSFDADWWDYEYMKEMTIGDNIFMLVGDVDMDRTRNLSCFFYNKGMYLELYGNEVGLYSLVKNKEWTIDKLVEMCKDAYVDVDTGGTVDDTDQLGMILNKDNILDGFFYGAGLKVTNRIDGDIPELDLVNMNSIDLCEKVMSMVQGKNVGIYTIPTQYDHEANAGRLQKFGNGKVLFSPGFIYHAEELVKLDTDYGMVPYPLANSEQSGYNSIVHNIICEMALPLTCKNPKMACAVLEELAFQGNKNVLPTYYEEILKFRYAQDPESAEMIDMIRDGCVTDIALIYPTTFNRLGIVLRVMAQEDKVNLQGVYAERESAAKAAINTFVQGFQAAG